MTDLHENTDNNGTMADHERYDEALNTAAGVIDALMDLVDKGYGILSIISTDGDTLLRKNFGFVKSDAMAFEHHTGEENSVSLKEFECLLAKQLNSSENSGSSLVMAVFDYIYSNTADDVIVLNKPEYAYQWSFEAGTIVPDYTSNNTWGGVEIQPGLKFVEGDEPDEPDYGIEEEFALPDTSMVGPFMTSLVRKAPDGNNVVTVVLSDIDADFNVSSFTFHKSGDTVSMDETAGALMVIDIASTVNSGEHAGVALRSYLDRTEKDGFAFETDSDERQEIRGWHLSLAGIHAFSADECLEVYSVDEETGEPVEPEPNVKYCAAWSLNEGQSR